MNSKSHSCGLNDMLLIYLDNFEKAALIKCKVCGDSKELGLFR